MPYTASLWCIPWVFILFELLNDTGDIYMAPRKIFAVPKMGPSAYEGD